MEDIAIQLAENVKALRLAVGLTQAELSSRAGVTVETVARLERVLRGRLSANANPSLETLFRLGSALGVSTAELLSGKSKLRSKDDRLAAVVKGATPATRRRILRIAEVLVREDRVESRKATKRRR